MVCYALTTAPPSNHMVVFFHTLGYAPVSTASVLDGGNWFSFLASGAGVLVSNTIDLMVITIPCLSLGLVIVVWFGIDNMKSNLLCDLCPDLQDFSWFVCLLFSSCFGFLILTRSVEV